jgi:ribonuclease VapC
VIVDSSALVAVLFEDDGYQELEGKMLEASVLAIGAPTLVETEMVVVGKYGEAAHFTIARLRENLRLEVVSFGRSHWEVAADAFMRFGKGRHPASLNYGDCMTYATARIAEKPLLFVGNDFARTDIESA